MFLPFYFFIFCKVMILFLFFTYLCFHWHCCHPEGKRKQELRPLLNTPTNFNLLTAITSCLVYALCMLLTITCHRFSCIKTPFYRNTMDAYSHLLRKSCIDCMGNSHARLNRCEGHFVCFFHMLNQFKLFLMEKNMQQSLHWLCWINWFKILVIYLNRFALNLFYATVFV